MPSVSKSEFAKHLGVTPGRVSQLLAEGLPQTADNRIDLATGLEWVSQRIDPSHKDAILRRAAVLAGDAPFPPPTQPTNGTLDAAKILLSAKAKRALLELRRAEREERRENGELIEISEIAQLVEGLVLNARNRLLSLGFVLAPRIAMETDPARCREMIDNAVVEALRELTEYRVA